MKHNSSSFKWRHARANTPQGVLQISAFKINKRIRPHLMMSGASYRIDETYVKVGGQWKFLRRALDKEGNMIELMLSAKPIFQLQYGVRLPC